MVGLQKKLVRGVGIGLFAALASACGTTGDSGEVPDGLAQIKSVLGTSSLLLPPIPVDIGPDGRVEKVADLPARTVDTWAERVIGNPLVGRVVVLDEEHLAWFDHANIQHVTLAIRPSGLYILVNGRELPHIAWDDESLDNLVQAIGKFQNDPADPDKYGLLSADTFKSFEATLPVLKTMNLTLNIRFPDLPEVGPPDRKPIPLPVQATFDKPAVATGQVREGDPTPVAAGDTAPPPNGDKPDEVPLQTVDMEIAYQPQRLGENDLGWVPSIFGFSTVDMQRIADSLATISDKRIKIPQLRMREDLRRRIEAEGIDSVGLELRSDGMFATVHGRLLPHLAWDEESLTNLSAVLEQLYPTGLRKLPDDARWVPVVRSTAPMYNDYHIAVLVSFPVE